MLKQVFTLILAIIYSLAMDACLAAPPVNPAQAIEMLKRARTVYHWDEAAEPFHIVGPIYFVGTRGLGAFLLHGTDGDMLINTGMPGSGPMLEASIRKLGFDPGQLKVLLAGHAHSSHVGGHAYLKKLTGAKIAFVKEEQELFESGGSKDFLYGGIKEFRFDASDVDRVLEDEEVITLGDLSVQVLRTGGHTHGATTYAMTVTDSGKTYRVLFPNGTTINPGVQLVSQPSYEGITEDYRRTFEILEKQTPDIWLHYTNELHGFRERLARAKKAGARAWVDPDGYRRWVAGEKRIFEKRLKSDQLLQK
ncbi:MBL fold metallo-hydrolase [Lacunimicrobium album]